MGNNANYIKSMIIGHEKILDFFAGAQEKRNLAHAFCFVGPDQVGKRTVAKNLSAQLLNTTVDKLAIHADFYYVQREEEEKTGKLKKDISIEQMRRLKERFCHKSWLGGNQVAIIEEAELLGQASNSILKVLEEPPKNSFIFLLATDEKKLLPTILSRCQKIFFSLLTDEEIKKGLQERGVSEELAEKITAVSWGRPGRAINFSQDPELLKEYFVEANRWKKLVGAPFYEKLKETDGLFGDKTDTQRDRDNLRNIMDIWITEWFKILKQKNLAETDYKKIIKLIDDLLAVKISLRQNIHPRLLVEQTLLNF